jgi:PEGA domain
MAPHARMVLVAWVLTWLYALPCAAQPEAPRNEEAAALFDRAVELYREGDLDAAVAQFERVYELAPKPAILYNLAQIQAERHQYVAATALYEKFLESSSEDASSTRKDDAREQLQKLRDRIAELWVESNVDEAELFIDDERVGTLPLEQPLKIGAGVSRIRVSKRGYVSAVHTLKVVGGDRPRLLLTLQPTDAEGAVPPTTTSTSAQRPSYLPFWIASASTLTFAVVALSTGLMARRTDRDLDAALNQLPASSALIEYERSRVRTFAAVTDGFGAAALVGLGVSAYLLIRPPGAAAEKRRLAVAPTLGGLSLHGTF